MQNKPSRTMRWLTLILQIASVLFSYSADALNIGVGNMASITAKYDSLFTPAGYTFAIWGVIYLALIAYCVVQLLPSQANHFAYERLNKYVRFSAVASIAWQIAYRYDELAVSIFIIFLMLIAAVILFVRAHHAVNRRNYNFWLTVPFSLYLGWLCVAVVANVSVLLVAINWNHAQMEPTTWVVIMLGIVLLITQSISVYYKDFVFPVVIAWAAVGIWTELLNRDISTAHACMGAAVIAILIGLYAAYKRMKGTNVVGKKAVTG